MQATAGDDTPAGLVSACEEATGVHAVVIPLSEDEKIVVVVEPGHDPGFLWHELQDFMRREGIE